MQIAASIFRSSTAANRALARKLARRPWVLSTMLVTLSFLIIAIGISAHIGIPIRDPDGTLLGRRLMLPFVFMCIFLSMDVFVRARRTWRVTGAPVIPTLRATFLRRWWWQRMLLAMMGFSAFHVTYLAYRNLKSFLPLIDYRTYDPQMLQIDRWMMFGHEPAVVLHNLLGTDVAAFVLSTIYLAFIPFVPISVAAALTFSARMRDGYVYVAAAIYSWILGTISYYIIPTLGPFGSDQDQFKGLAYTGVTRLQEALISQRGHLISDPIGETFIQGVAGFASLHVGVVFMAYCFCRWAGHRRLARVAMAALIPTIIATIYFGWHYIPDDIAGLFIGWFAVLAARWTVYPTSILHRRMRSPVSGAAPGLRPAD